VLAFNVQPQALLEFTSKIEKEYGVSIVCSAEEIPMGTAGPIFLARSHLLADSEPFFMFNSDVICDFPLASMLAFHRAHGGEGTILTTKVKEPSKYGVVVSEPHTGQIQRFVEKPVDFVGDEINAGIYLFNTDVVQRVQNKPTSIEREIFPAIAAERQLYSMLLKGYWMDIGQPKDYLLGQVLHLSYTARVAAQTLTCGDCIRGNVLIHPSANVAKTAIIGPDVVIGAGVVVEDGARVKRSCLLDGVRVCHSALVSSSIIGWNSSIGSHAHVNDSVLGEDVQIAAEIAINQLTVCPHKAVTASEYQHKIIM